MSKQRTITLTGRPPVKINEEDWPVLAESGWGDYDNQYEFQANRTADVTLKVRRHADGRSIVYGTYRYSTQFPNDRDVYVAAGELLSAEDGIVDVVTAIRDTTDRLSSYESLPEGWQPDWQKLADECVADLPAEEL